MTVQVTRSRDDKITNSEFVTDTKNNIEATRDTLEKIRKYSTVV
jgi:hypothetical protein